MQKIFKVRTYEIQITFGSKRLMSTGPQIWNNLPNELKSAEI